MNNSASHNICNSIMHLRLGSKYVRKLCSITKQCIRSKVSSSEYSRAQQYASVFWKCFVTQVILSVTECKGVCDCNGIGCGICSKARDYS